MKIKQNFFNYFPSIMLMFLGFFLLVFGLYLKFSNINNNLYQNNEVDYIFQYTAGFLSYENLSSAYILFIVAGAILFAFGFFKFLYLKSILILIDDNKISKRTGLFSTNIQEISLQAIETVNLKRNFFDFLTGSGTIILTGRGNTNIVLENIDNPNKVKNIISSYINNNYAN